MAQGILNTVAGLLLSNGSIGSLTFDLDAANDWFAMSFIGNGKTISTVFLYQSAMTGTPAAADVTLDIYSTNSSGDPDASVSGPHACNDTPTAGTWLSWSPSYATTDGVMYYVVVKNINGTPASNFPRFRWQSGTIHSPWAMGSLAWGWTHNRSTDGGSTWTNNSQAASGMMLHFSDTTYDGGPFSFATTSASTVYATRELGSIFTLPADVSLRVRGLVFNHNSNTGTPAAAARARLYSGSGGSPTLVATSSGGPVAGQFATNSTFYYPFASVQVLAPATTYRVVFGTTGADTSSNAYRTYELTIRNAADAKALMPFGNAHKVYYDASSWAEDDTALIPFGLHLDNGAEWSASSSGGGLLRPVAMNGGFQ